MEKMEKFIKQILAGKERAVARAISLIENKGEGAGQLMKGLYLQAGTPYLVGITGPPGAGKSTLSEKLVSGWRKEGVKVGVIAIDPSSQYSGGALLGDRIRMNKISTDPEVFIRSMATRGALGGLNPAIFDTIIILAAAGYQHILIETVGVGQNEIDVVDLADTTLVATVPEAGDEIQTFKAGLMEVGDIFVINKADRPGVDRMELIIKQMLSSLEKKTDWIPPVVRTVATDGDGVEKLLKLIGDHREYLSGRDRSREKKQRFIRHQLLNLMEEKLREQIILPLVNSGEVEDRVQEISRLKADPYTAVEELLKDFL